MIRTVIVDDQAVVRTGLRIILESQSDIEVVAEGANGREALDLVLAHPPDVVLMDIRMPVMDGIEATGKVVQAAPATRVLVLTTYDIDEYVYETLRAGAAGFLIKTDSPASIIEGVRVVAEGNSLLAPEVTRRLIDRFVATGPPKPPAGIIDELTERERDVLHEVARGLSNAEIAAQLFIGEGTVKTHVARILSKLNLRDRVQVVVFAYDHGLVRPGAEGEKA
jgi:DNA-binding NarL/FixJ family response regulator